MNPLDWIKMGVPSAIALALGVWLLFTEGRYSAAQSSLRSAQVVLAAAQRDLSTCRGNAATLSDALDAATRATQAMKAAGAAADAAARAQVAKARTANKALADRLASLESDAKTGTRPAGMDACTNADRLIDEEIQRGLLP